MMSIDQHSSENKSSSETQDDNESQVHETNAVSESQEAKPEDKKNLKPKSKDASSKVDALKKSLEDVSDPEEKLKLSIEFMKTAISQSGTPRFKDFWEAKKVCLPLFKEKVHASIKAKYWKEYIELSSEAKRLKEILDEQSSFAIEQIELALSAIEKDIASVQEQAHEKATEEFPKNLIFLKNKLSEYENIQKEINFYMTLSGRTKDLRKEIIQTEMRIKFKNKLLEKLSGLADQFLPKKKKLIKTISEKYTADIKAFSEKFFDLEKKQLKPNSPPYYKLRDEIKDLQKLSKMFSLNSHSFADTRLVLSECWQILKVIEKEKRKHFHETKQAYSESLSAFAEDLKQLKAYFDENPPKNEGDVHSKIKELQVKLKEKKLGKKDHIHSQKDLYALEELLLKPFKEKALEAKKLKEEKIQKQKEQIVSFKEKYLSLIAQGKESSLHQLKEALDTFKEEKKSFKLSFIDKLKFSEIQREIYELVLFKEQDEIDAPEEQQNDLKALHVLWEQFREETRLRLENYRKEMGRSGFDFEKAMLYREYIDLEKARLDRAVEKIEEIEDQLEY